MESLKSIKVESSSLHLVVKVPSMFADVTADVELLIFTDVDTSEYDVDFGSIENAMFKDTKIENLAVAEKFYLNLYKVSLSKELREFAESKLTKHVVSCLVADTLNK